ncbi:aspartate-semialdehyde dehydrogenase [Canicola haemoglobinophilus]|uniref:Aspartate-semialdehyde dehydrogenase n=1 Tax=Canicola haemoglobinophilus TaxID=733 RepID=A0A1V4AZL5_9PAST|nr:oxidoreductase [Canicola haemoglobinophilus]OOR98653.1 aspartate-semialdehyde dehydrogenase [Canicola haemoglobinophilus]STO60635.1 aspartate-semialdehyde dehydrogenase [Canicola haemoglobinophilus]
MLNIAIAAEFELAEKIAETLEQSQLEIESLKIVEIIPFNEEQGVRFKNKAVAQIASEEADWSEFNYVLFAGSVEQANLLAQAADAGCIVIDVLGICANISDIPVVVPSINEEQVVELRQRNIVSLPNPQVTQCALAINKMVDNIRQVVITSLLPASYTNAEQVAKLAGQTAQLLNGIPLDEEQQRLAFDVFPVQNQNLAAQLQKIYPQLDNVVFHQIQVPVFYGMGQFVTTLSDYAIDIESQLQAWQESELTQYHAEKVVTPVSNGESENREENVKLHISALSVMEKSAVENSVEFWSVADEQRFNLALMAVKLVELIG